MEFLYPKFNKVTHILKQNAINSQKYPDDRSFLTKTDLQIQQETKICLIRDNIGSGCQWSEILCLEGPNKNSKFYVLTNELQSTSNKISYIPICTLENSIDNDAPEIDPNTKEILVPYIDKKNALYSIRIQTENEKAVSSFLFENLVNEVLIEGVGVLLSSRGYRFDNEYVQSLLEKYQRFAYVNDDIDLTINRACEPLTFTVSIPLNFFNEAEISANNAEQGDLLNQQITKKLSFNNRNFKTKINRLIEIFQSIDQDVQKLLYPSNFIENFVISFELETIKEFSKKFQEFVSLQTFPINDPNLVNFYELGFDDDLNLLSFLLENANKKKLLNPAELSSYRLNPELNSKRIYNYLLNLDEMSSDVRSMDVKEFIFKYVNYPEPRFLTDTVTVNGKKITDEQTKQFKSDYGKSSEECISLSDLTSIGRSATSLVSFTDPLYHIFLKDGPIKNLEDYNTYKSFIQQGKSSQDALKAINDSLKKTQNPEPTAGEKKIKEDLQKKANQNLEDRKKVLDQSSENLSKINKDLTSAQQQLQALNEEQKNLNGPTDPEALSKIENLENQIADLENKQKQAVDEKNIQNDKYNQLLEQKKEIDKTPANLLAQDKELEKWLGDNEAQIDEFKKAFSKLSLKNEFLEALTSSVAVNFSFANSVANIEYGGNVPVNISTLLYLLNRVNLSEALFKKLLCALKGTPADNPEIAQILSQIPVEIINYFNYLRTIKELNGTTFIQALESGLVPDVKLYCSQNNALIYFVKGLKKLLTTLNNAASISINVIPSLGSTTKLTQKTNAYEVFAKNFTQNVIRTITSLLIDLIRDLLDSSCEDPLLNPSSRSSNESGGQFTNPFDTHYPTGGFNSPFENNNNPDTLSRNRGDVLDKIYFQELQAGFDREYTISLIGKLLKDINCILTPIESVNLLKGEVTDLTKALIKNIIRAKYSSPPNDLSFLLSDDQKLKLLFKELGLTVDPDYISVITQTVSNYLEASSLCDEPTLRARTELLQNKIPKDLGTLERQQQKRIQTAKRLFERIKNGGFPADAAGPAGIQGGGATIQVSPFCPDFSNDETDGAKEQILNDYQRSIRSTFSNVLSDFTQEAIQLSNIHTDTLPSLRYDTDGNLFDSINYTLYNYELGVNLRPIKNSELNPSKPDSETTNTGDFRVDYNLVGNFNSSLMLNLDSNVSLNSSNEFYGTKYVYRPIKISTNLSELSNVLIPKSQEQAGTITCQEKELKFDTGFINFLASNNIVAEFADDFQFDSDNGDLNEYYDEEQSGYNQRDAQFLRSKRYFVTISLDKDTDTLFLVNADLISIKLIYNNTATKKFEIQEEVTFEGDMLEGFSTDNFLDNFDSVVESFKSSKPSSEFFLEDYKPQTADEILNGFSDIIEQKTNKENNLVVLNQSDDIYLVSKELFSRLDPRSQQKIQEIYLNIFKPKIEKIENFEKIKNNVETLLQIGLFQNETLLDVSNQKIIKNVKITSAKTNETSIEPEYFSNQLFSISSSIEVNGASFSKFQTQFDNMIGNFKEYIINPNYFVIERTREEFKAKKKTDSWAAGQSANLEIFQDKEYDIIFDPSKDTTQQFYAKYSLLNIPQDQRYINCNIYPHYLNLDYIIDLATISKRNELCDIGNYNINDIIKICIVELTIRTYITDLLVKAIPYLSTFNENNLRNFYSNETQLQIIKEFFKRDLKIFSPDNKTSGADSYYYRYLNELIKDVYEIYKKNNFLKAKFISLDSKELELDYFIKKEIFRTINYMLSKNMIDLSRPTDYVQVGKEKIVAAFAKGVRLPDTSDVAAINIEEDTPETQEARSAAQDFLKFWKFEYDSFLAYFLMAETVDTTKRSIFYSTKSGLASILFSNLGDLTNATPEEIADISGSERSQEDIIRFLQNLSASPNPAAVTLLKPEYSKYTKKFLNLLLQTTRNTLSTLAENTDPNIALTKKINYLTTFVSATAFSFLDEKTKNLLVANDPTLVQKRISDGRSPTPDILVSLAVSFGIPPLLTGWAYLASDTIQEAVYMQNAFLEVQQLKNSILRDTNGDPCAIKPADLLNAADNIECSPKNKRDLRVELNSLESDGSGLSTLGNLIS